MKPTPSGTLMTEVMPLSTKPSIQERLKPACDLSKTCLSCGGKLVDEHAHMRCEKCHERDSCCMG